MHTKNIKYYRRNKVNLNKWKDMTVPRLKDSLLKRCQFSPKLIYRFNSISLKILVSCFEEIDKLALKYIYRRHQNTEIIYHCRRKFP